MIIEPLHVWQLITLISLLCCFGCGPTGSLNEEQTTGLARQALTNDAFQWDHIPADNYTSYVPSGAFPASHAEELHARTGEALRHALKVLYEDEFPAHLRVFYVGSRDDMALITGEKYTGIADAQAHAVILVENATWRAFARHEVMHAVSLLLWGEPGGAPVTPADSIGFIAWQAGGWLREGLAVMAEDRCGAYTNRQAAAAMQKESELLPIETLMNDFYQQDDLVAYLQAGALMEYVYVTYGMDRFRELWRTGSVTSAYGISALALEAEWLSWLRATSTQDLPESVAVLRGLGCG